MVLLSFDISRFEVDFYFNFLFCFITINVESILFIVSMTSH